MFSDRAAKAFTVGAKEIRDSAYDLSIGRYQDPRYEEETFDPPTVILKRLRNLETDILKDLNELEGMLV